MPSADMPHNLDRCNEDDRGYGPDRPFSGRGSGAQHRVTATRSGGFGMGAQPTQAGYYYANNPTMAIPQPEVPETPGYIGQDQLEGGGAGEYAAGEV